MADVDENPKRVKTENRGELQERISDWLDVPLSILAFIMLGLLVVELAMDLSPENAERVTNAQTAIWIIFIAAFLLEFTLAPFKLAYLKTNWLTALSVALPAFRAFRIVRVARALRGLSLVRILTTLNRGARALGTIAQRGQLGYIVLLTVIVTLTGSAGIYYFESGVPNGINSFGQALWWAVTLVTTINTGLEPVTLEGRIVGVLMRVYALAISGYLTAIIAIYLLGWREPETEDDERAAERREIVELRQEIARLRQTLDHASAGTVSRVRETD